MSVSKKLRGRKWTEFICLRIVTSGDCYKNAHEFLGFYERQSISWLSERLLVLKDSTTQMTVLGYIFKAIKIRTRKIKANQLFKIRWWAGANSRCRGNWKILSGTPFPSRLPEVGFWRPGNFIGDMWHKENRLHLLYGPRWLTTLRMDGAIL
jgi:hypothetical protein